MLQVLELESFQCTSFVQHVKQNPESPACFRFRRVFHHCLLYVSDSGDFHRCLLYVSDFGDFFTAVFWICIFQIPETFSPLSAVCFGFWRLVFLPVPSVCFRFQRLFFNHCLLHVSDSGELTDIAQRVKAGVAVSERKVVSHDNGRLHAANNDSVLVTGGINHEKGASYL